MIANAGPRPHKPPPQFTPPRNAPCLCGSGLKYKRCCADRLPGHEHLGSRTRKLLNEQRFKEALFACRADITQYTIWHKSHTEPAIHLGMPRVGSLLEIDINALGSIVDDLLFCHIKNNLMEDFSAVLERLRANIDDPRWHRKIIYFHAMHALWPDWDENAGRKELRKLGSIADDKDVEILELYLDLFDDDLTFSEKQDVIDKIIEHTRKPSHRLHYRASKAVLYLTIGDQKRAEALLTEAIDETRSEEEKGKLSKYHKYRLAMTLDLLGIIRQDQILFGQATKIYDELLAEEDYWSSNGRANLFALRGDSYKHEADWERARQSYISALALRSAPIYKVFLCECLIQLGKLDEANKTLADVKIEQLSPAEQADFAFATAALAIEFGERVRLEKARDILKRVHVPEPLFRQRRDSLLLNVQEALVSGRSKSIIARTRALLSGALRSFNSYVILKPNVMGFGLDVNQIFEDLSRRREEETSEHRSSPPGASENKR